MKILVLIGSPRKNGNSAALAAAFAEGAQSAGHEVTTLNVGTMKIGACLACEYCHTKGEGSCIQKDDMQKVYPELAAADMIVFACPIHYFNITGELQCAITRFYAKGKPAAKKYAMILSSASEGVYNAAIAQYKTMTGYFGAEDMGIKTFSGGEQTAPEKLEELRAFGASL